MLKIGVLALQGSVEEHLNVLARIENVIPCKVKSIADLESVSALIIPGGESTVIGKLLKNFGLFEPIIERVNCGMPIWGTCAGMVLLAQNIVNEDYRYLGLLNISVRRNAYGSQLDSFSTKLRIPLVSLEEIPLIFIRAPWVEKIEKDVEILATIDEHIVAVKQNNILATSFHPELTDDISFHKFFVSMVD